MNRILTRLLALCVLGVSLDAFAQSSPPTLTSVSPSSGPTAGNVPITLNGSNLDTATSVSLSGVDCPIQSKTPSQVICQLPEGEGVNKAFAVTNPSGVSNGVPFNYASPSITSVSPTSIPGQGGATLTLSGTNFGLAPTVQLDVGACTISTHTHQQIVCTPPVGAGTGHTVRVTVAQQQSNALSWKYDPPVISNVSPQTIPTTGAPISIAGLNFGTSGAAVTVNGFICPVTSQGPTSLQCNAPAGTGTAKAIVVTVGGQASSGGLTLSYSAPTLSSISPPNGPTQGGLSLQLQGSNFGTSGATVTVGGKNCPVTFQNHSQMLCTLPAGQGVGHPVVVTVAGQTSNTLTYDYGGPTLSGITPMGASTEGGVAVTIFGQNLGETGGSVLIGGVSCPITQQADTQVVCTLPPGVGANLPVSFSVDGRAAPQTLTYSYGAPTVSSVSPSSGPTAGGTTITIAGSNFGASGAFVQIGGAPCPVTSQTHQQLECTLPAGKGTNKVLQVIAGNQQSLPAQFSYDAPTLTSVSPSTGPTAGGALLVLTGANFSTSADSILVGGKSCAPQSYSDAQITCTLPPGTGTNKQVTITVGGQTSNALLFSYEAPAITQLTPAPGPTAGNVPLTIDGANFGATGATVTLGSATCPVTAQSDNQVTCTLPEGLGTGFPVVVTVDGQSSAPAIFDYAAPTLSSVSPSFGPLAGGVTLILSGANFGAQGATVSLSGVDCPVTMQTHSTIDCTLPAGAGPNKQFVVTSADGRTSNAISFSYASSPPVVSSDSVTTDEDTPVAITLQGTDLDGDPLTYQIVSPPQVGEGTVTVKDNEATFTPGPNFNGATKFSFKANDGALDSNTASIDVTVTPVNDAPVALDASAMTDEDAKVTITLGASDVDGDPLTFALGTLPESNQGEVTLDGDQATFTPAPDFRGVATFTFTATDGALVSNEATITVQVAGQNDPPVAQAQTASGDEDTAIVITLQATDADGDPLTYALATPVPQGQGTVTLDGAVATYTPPQDFNGMTSFAFTASDGTLTSEPAAVSVEVKPVNDAPVAEGGQSFTPRNTPLTLALRASDVDGDPLTFTVKTQPEDGSGTVTIDGDHATFTPAQDRVGPSTFVFEASDGVATSTATVTITIEDAPAGGCGCGTTTGGAAVWMIAFAVAAFMTRRRRA